MNCFLLYLLSVMKKIIVSTLMLFGLFWFSQAAVLDDAVSWMNTNWLTIFKTTKDYQPNSYIRRDEAAKVFVNFYLQDWKKNYVRTKDQCNFSDLNYAHKDLKNIVVESCRLGLFEGYQGKFMPTSVLTNQQALAVYSRARFNPTEELQWLMWTDEYYKKLTKDDLEVNLVPFLLVKNWNVTRWDIALLIYNQIGNVLERLSNVQDSAQDMVKMADLMQTSIALQTYQLDNNTYPIYDSFVDVSQLSSFLIWWKNEYLKSMPISNWSTYYYKSSQKDTWFILMVELSPESKNANFFWSKEDIDKSSLIEIKKIIENPIQNDWKARYIVTN